MTKNVKMVVFVEAKEYLELLNEARALKIEAKTDSELIRKLFYYFVKRVPDLMIEVDNYRRALAEKNSVIEVQTNTIKDLKLNNLRNKTKKK